MDLLSSCRSDMKRTITHRASHGHVHDGPNTMQTPKHDTHSVNKTQETNLDALFNDVLICLPVTAAMHGTHTLLGTLPSTPLSVRGEWGLTSPTPCPHPSPHTLSSPLSLPRTKQVWHPLHPPSPWHTLIQILYFRFQSLNNSRDVISVIIR